MPRRDLVNRGLTAGFVLVIGLCLSSAVLVAHTGSGAGAPRGHLSGVFIGSALVSLGTALFIVLSARSRRRRTA